MKRLATSVAAIVLAASPIVGLGAIGSLFLATPNDRAAEYLPISLAGVSAEPKLVKLFAVRRDAWMRMPDEPAGCAHVRRTPSGEITVLWSSGIRLGDFISYEPALGCYRSDCFHSRFDLDGKWFHDANESMFRVEDMRPLPFRVVDGELIVTAYSG